MEVLIKDNPDLNETLLEVNEIITK